MNGNYDSSKKCVIVASGDLGEPDLFRKYKDRFAIFVDGGLRYAQSLSMKPDLIIGDMDSFMGDPYSFGCEVIEHDSIKDDTDTGLAVKYAIEHGFDDIVILAGIGSRLDHTFANIQTLAFAAKKGVCAKLDGGNNFVFVTKKSPIIFDKIKGSYISIFAFDNCVSGVTLKGMKYPLENAVLSNSFPIGVSNECVFDSCQIAFDHGLLMVIVSSDADLTNLH